MMNSNWGAEIKGSTPQYRASVMQRETIVKMLRAALESGEYRFARQAALSWLAAFPGDLEITLLQAQAVIAEGKPALVIPALDLVCRKDPFYLDAYRVLAWASRELDPTRSLRAKTAAYVLGDRIPDSARLEEWGKPLKEAYVSFEAQKYVEALPLVEEVLGLVPDLPLAQALHLLISRSVKTSRDVLQLALDYHTVCPDSLPAGLILAESYLQQGSELEAVRLLHLSAAGDSTGRMARRIWGENHSYRSLWPDDMVILFDQPVPAGVAGKLGWNRLTPGEILPPAAPPIDEPALKNEAAQSKNCELDPDLESLLSVLDAFVDPAAVELAPGPEYVAPFDQPESNVSPAPADGAVAQNAEVSGPAEDSRPGFVSAVVPPIEGINHATKEDSAGSIRKNVENELDHLARKLHQPALGRADGRFPVYVILSSREGLEGQYGPQTASVVDGELRRLAAAVGKRQGWQALVFYPDDAACVGQYGMISANPRDPWKVKHALADLDAALSKRGEMVGALLIVGGESVLPFHRLPNPTEDSDGEVVSDSPYATLDANYFVPEWPVGRLPGEAGEDAGALLEQIRQVQRFHARRADGRLSFSKDWLLWLRAQFDGLFPIRSAPNFGYTAAVWRRSSLAVFRPIGAPHTVVTSPPVFSGNLKPHRLTSSNLGYYNLHGLEDSPAWYGQRDPVEAGDIPDYPVAITPEDLRRNGRSTKFIFSEACYGGHIAGKTEKDSLALRFISLGSLGVVASSCISYGSVSTPLIAADLLGHLFWQHMKAGKTAGEALMQSKVDLVREMNRRQGYLDGEDQKTLISFILYGDPLASYDGFRLRSKGFIRSKEHPMVHTISGDRQEVLSPSKVPAGVLKGVKQAVAEYLPGADVAGIHFCRLHPHGSQSETQAAGSPLLGRKLSKGESQRLVVTVSKQVMVAQHLHRHFLHVTMDESGKMVKVALSR
jgi:hypothetical protein